MRVADYAGAEAALAAFLGDRNGKTLQEKSASWKPLRRGYTEMAARDAGRAEKLSAVDLVPSAAYWRAASLVELRRFEEAEKILDELSGFPGLRIGYRVKNLRKVCAAVLGEGS